MFQQFDRLLFLATEGKTVYFGEIGNSSKTITSYFERNGARACGKDENPAEWMLEVTGAAPGSESSQDWPAIWNNSGERDAVKAELARMKDKLSQQPVSIDQPDSLRPFAASFSTQLWIVLVRVFQQYWRTPSYLYSKVALCLFSVSPIPIPKHRETCLTLSLGTLHRILLLENSQLASGTAEPTLRCLRAPHNLRQLLSADPSALRNTTRPVRSA